MASSHNSSSSSPTVPFPPLHVESAHEALPEALSTKSERQNTSKSPENSQTPTQLDRCSALRRGHDREFAYRLVYHEAISRGQSIPQARHAVEAERLTHSRAKQMAEARAASKLNWHQRQRPDRSHAFYCDANRTSTRRHGIKKLPSNSSSWEDEAPRPILFMNDRTLPRGRSKARAPRGSPAPIREGPWQPLYVKHQTPEVFKRLNDAHTHDTDVSQALQSTFQNAPHGQSALVNQEMELHSRAESALRCTQAEPSRYSNELRRLEARRAHRPDSERHLPRLLSKVQRVKSHTCVDIRRRRKFKKAARKGNPREWCATLNQQR